MNAAIKQDINILVSSKDYFSQVLDDAFYARKIKAENDVRGYLVQVLEHYLDAQNLFDKEKVDEAGRRKPTTLAELYLTAASADFNQRIELLKRLGDKSLYISGFFGDSLQRKVIDIEYYVNMGGSAYNILAKTVDKNDPQKNVFETISRRFVDFVEALSYISQNVMISNNQSLLRLYDRYLQTGSTLAKEKLLELGIVTISGDPKNPLKHEN
ncbi:MAG: hypothetical protein JNL11_12610 [Bdellovibrionaceae bacterium]|nr:hypothetical protein [Pseudobdellovibrionaceae bacterium]